MRLIFNTPLRVLKAAKTISKVVGYKLSYTQNILAKVCGYRDLHELQSLCVEDELLNMDENLKVEQFINLYVELVPKLASELNLNEGFAQYLLSVSSLTGNRKHDIEEQILLRLKLLRNNELPFVPKRTSGAIGKTKSYGNSQNVILREYGKPTRVITHRSGNAGLADFEYVSPKNELGLFIPRRTFFAYGCWTEKDGAKVYFNKDYAPMWRVRAGSKFELVNPNQEIEFTKQEFFWTGLPWPYFDEERAKQEINRLRSLGLWALPITIEALHILIRNPNEALHILIRNPNIDNFKDANEILNTSFYLGENCLKSEYA